jgi:hypothetical protein
MTIFQVINNAYDSEISIDAFFAEADAMACAEVELNYHAKQLGVSPDELRDYIYVRNVDVKKEYTTHLSSMYSE